MPSSLTWTTSPCPTGKGRVHRREASNGFSFILTPHKGRFYARWENGGPFGSFVGTLGTCKAWAEKQEAEWIAAAHAAGKPVSLSNVLTLEDAQDAAPVDSLPETDLASIDGAKIDSSPILSDATPIPRGWGSVATPEPAPEPMPSASQITKPTGKSRGISVAYLYKHTLLRGLFN